MGAGPWAQNEGRDPGGLWGPMMPLDAWVCLRSLAVPSSCRGTATCGKDLTPAQVAQRSETQQYQGGRGGTKEVMLQVPPASPLDLGHQLALGLQTIFRPISFPSPFYFIVNISLRRFLVSHDVLFLWLRRHPHKEKCFHESAHVHLPLHLNQVVWTPQWKEFCGQCRFGIFHFGEGWRILDTCVIAGFVHFFCIVFL